MCTDNISRRNILIGSCVAAKPAVLRVQTALPVNVATEAVRNNASSFVTQRWEVHFDTLGSGAIVAELVSRAVHYWSADGQDYRLYPSSVPMTEDLTKRGYTEIVRKKTGSDWTPTPSMMEKEPTLQYMPAGPANPLGTHAMYPGWSACIIHGTHDTGEIGRRSSSGCLGLCNEHIKALLAVAPVGPQVRLI